jgi:hypothetical protein
MHLTDVAAGKQPDQKKPFPLEMTRFMIEVILREDTMMNRLVRVAALMAYFLLLRQSEYIYTTGESSHALLAKNIEFRMNGKFVPAHLITTEEFGHVESVRITLPHCKNDPFHRGNSFWYEARSVQAGQYDIVFEMFQWTKVAKFTSEDVFTSFRDERGTLRRLTYYTVMQKMRSTAIAFHLDPSIFGTHSWRIAGATTMDAASASMTAIQRQGRWKSTDMPMHYSKSSRNEFGQALGMLANETVFTVQDLLYHYRK